MAKKTKVITLSKPELERLAHWYLCIPEKKFTTEDDKEIYFKINNMLSGSF